MLKLVPALSLVFMLAITGCATPAATPAGPGPGAAAQPAADDKPVTPKVNRIVMGLAAPAVEANELRNIDGRTTWQLRPMYEDLIGVDPASGALIPQLALSWAVEPDGRSLRFKLRQGVPFHGGKGEFTSKDLEQPWREVIKEDSTSGTTPYWRGALNGIEPAGDYEAIYRLKGPDGYFFESISEARSVMEVFSKADYDARGPSNNLTKAPMVGTGPYEYVDRKQGEFLRYKRAFDKHWRTTPDFPEFEFRWMKEGSTRLAALLTGEIQIADLPEDLKAQALRQNMAIAKGKVPALRTFLSVYCCMFKDLADWSKGYAAESPLKDVRVRRALSKAINREELNKAFFAGKGETMVLNHFYPNRPGWNPEWEKRFPEEYGYDPAKARALLAEAGFPSGSALLTNVILQPVAGYSGGEDVAEAIVGYWRAVGIGVKTTPMDAATFEAQRRALKFENDIVLDATNATQWTGALSYGSSLGVRRGVESPEVDTLLKQLNATLDEKAQAERWRQIGDARFNQALDIPLFWLPVEAVVDPKIIREWVFPGSLTGSWTHVQNIKAAR